MEIARMLRSDFSYSFQLDIFLNEKEVEMCIFAQTFRLQSIGGGCCPTLDHFITSSCFVFLLLALFFFFDHQFKWRQKWFLNDGTGKLAILRKQKFELKMNKFVNLGHC